ncbi:flagellar hook-length control protein FliK [Devosia sp.]|uniref:flagellar hook-length control protein FliK n=1 Tax=Devosia sp. TaxID=1871048 RepID=UPI002FC5FA87
MPAQPSAAAAPAGIRPVVPVSPTTPAANAVGNPLPTATSQQPAASPPATAQAALAQMVQASVPRQGAATGLTAALTGIAGKVVLPEPVARAAQQVLARRVAIDAPKFDGAMLQTAVKRSGVFQEAGLARGQMPLPQTDMKSALLALRQTLVTWLGPQAPVAAVAHIPPPLKGGVPRARGAEAPPVDPSAAPEEVGKQLLERTESALARVRLHQHASLPDAMARTADWSTDLPVLIGSQQTLLQLQIHRDQHNESDATAERGWQMRFAISLPGMGEVGAQVSLRAGATGIMLWATEPGTSTALEGEVASLRDTLAAAGLNPGAVIVRHGEPPTPPPAPTGHFVDART